MNLLIDASALYPPWLVAFYRALILPALTEVNEPLGLLFNDRARRKTVELGGDRPCFVDFTLPR